MHGSPLPARRAIRLRRSYSSVTDTAPSPDELAGMVADLVSLPDHSRLRPWRLIALRGKARRRLGKALAKASDTDRERAIAKAERAPLVIGIVVSPHESNKVPLWEQEAVASGAAHLLSVMLHEAGWGSIWRTGPHTRSKPVRKAMRLEAHEYLLGWLYVGGIAEGKRENKPRKPLDLTQHLSEW